MAYKLNIVDQSLGLNCNVRYTNLSKRERPSVTAKAPNGNVVKERTTFQGTVLAPGSTQRQWVDDNGAIYAKQDLKFYYEGEEVSEIEQTKIFEIAGFQDLSNYTDNYVIDKYYELYPDINGMKKDIDKKRAEKANLYQMRKLWEYLDSNKKVARGVFCTSSRGFIESDGYIRAIKINGKKWGLEIGLFREEKVFEHLQETIPSKVEAPVASSKKKKLKMV